MTTPFKTPHGRRQVRSTFGVPDTEAGEVNASWRAANIRPVIPPPSWRLFRQHGNALAPLAAVRLHQLLAPSFTAVLNAVWAHAESQVGVGAPEDLVRAWLHERRLDRIAGAYNFRLKRSGRGLSLHSYGIAIDWDPLHNPRRKPLTHTLPTWWYEIWRAHGWHDGRGFPTPDPMHVQFATGT